MKKTCNIIGDLLPLYVEGVASEDTVAFVKDHLEHCTVCRAAWEKMTRDTSLATEDRSEEGLPIKKLKKKMTRRKTITVIASVLLTLAVLFVWLQIKPYDVYYGNSELYSKADMNAAIRVIKQEFRTWDGCKLYTIRYTNDELCQKELDYCNSLAKDGQIFTECIIFKSDFRSPLFNAGAWNPGEIYYGWTWYLARTNNGNWVLLTSGYA